MFRCTLENLTALFREISGIEKLYIPVDGNGGAEYKLWEEGLKLSSALKTERSAKDFFFPQTENIAKFKTEGKKIEIIDNRRECDDFVIFGVRACDVKSFDVLDNVFLSEPADSFYKNRREHALIMSMACTRPSETCFCRTFGIDPAEPAGDIACYMESDALYLDPVTDKGINFCEKLKIIEKCDNSAVEEQKKLIAERMAKLPLSGLTADKFGPGKTDEFFSDLAWKTLSEACLGCGTCTYVCPTCQCYDIKDFDTGHGIQRFRCWDSCMYSEFTKMSAGQPRLTQIERFRQRFMHKLVYYPENNSGLFGCVGCGRCLAKCPIKMNIVKVMKKLGEGGNAQ